MNRRELLKMLAAGGVMTSAGLWMPGTKVISIPSGKVFGNEYGINSMFRLLDEHTVEYIGAEDKVVSVPQFFDWMKKNAAHMMRPWSDESDLIVTMRDNFRLTNPEHLHEGSLSQAADDHLITGLREMWMNPTSLGDNDLVSDKFYFQEDTTPRKRHERGGSQNNDYKEYA